MLVGKIRVVEMLQLLRLEALLNCVAKAAWELRARIVAQTVHDDFNDNCVKLVDLLLADVHQPSTRAVVWVLKRYSWALISLSHTQLDGLPTS